MFEGVFAVPSGVPMTGVILSASGFRLPASGFRLPASGFRLAAGGWRLAAGGWRLARSRCGGRFTLAACPFGSLEDQVHNRTAVLLTFSLRLPSVTATGRWRERGDWAGGNDQRSVGNRPSPKPYVRGRAVIQAKRPRAASKQ